MRDKKAHHCKWKSGAVYVSEYGISAGRCNRDEIGAVIGGMTSAVVGHAIGDSMDETGRGEWGFRPG